jgi:WD40-like Beta Propeller Repeat
MKTKLLSILCLLFAAMPAVLRQSVIYAQRSRGVATSQGAGQNQPDKPPEVTSAQPSPDRKYLAFLKPSKGSMNIWVKRAGEPFDQARQFTSWTDRPIDRFFWSRDGKYVLFVHDRQRDRNFNVYAVRLADAFAPNGTAPKAINITNEKKLQAVIYRVSPTQSEVIEVGLNDRDPAWHDLYEVNIVSGARHLVRQNYDRVTPSGTITENSSNRVDVTGKWNMIVSAQGLSIPVTVEMEQQGEVVRGTFSSHAGGGTLRDGQMNGNAITAIARVNVQGQTVDLDLKGTINGEKMSGSLSGQGLPPISFTATRSQ